MLIKYRINYLASIAIYTAITVALYLPVLSFPTVVRTYIEWANFIGSLDWRIIAIMVLLSGVVSAKLLMGVGGYPLEHGLSAPENIGVKRCTPALIAIILSIAILAPTPNGTGQLAAEAVIILLLVGFTISSQMFNNMLLSCFLTDSEDIESNEEAPISSIQQDTYNRVKIAEKIADTIRGRNNTHYKRIALMGRYGSGKSSILNLVKEIILKSKEKDKWLFIVFDAWGKLQVSDKLASMLLEAIVDELAKITAVSSIRQVPANYLTAMKDLHASTKALSHLISPHDNAAQQLLKLNNLLESLDLNVCVFIEDIDRNKDPFDTCNAVAPLLDALGKQQRISLILTLGYQDYLSNILHRVTEYREDLPSIDFSNELKVFIRTKLEHAESNNIDLLFINSRNIPAIHPYYEFTTIFGTNNQNISLNLLKLISTPREFEAIKKEVDLKWDSIIGEFNFGDLLIISVLKICEPSAFDLILNCHGLPELESSWKSLEEKHILQHPEEVKNLINFLYPTKNSDKIYGPPIRLQSLSFNKTYKDYWSIYQPATNHPPKHTDQELFKTLKTWQREIESYHGEIQTKQELIRQCLIDKHLCQHLFSNLTVYGPRDFSTVFYIAVLTALQKQTVIPKTEELTKYESTHHHPSFEGLYYAYEAIPQHEDTDKLQLKWFLHHSMSSLKALINRSNHPQKLIEFLSQIFLEDINSDKEFRKVALSENDGLALLLRNLSLFDCVDPNKPDSLSELAMQLRKRLYTFTHSLNDEQQLFILSRILLHPTENPHLYTINQEIYGILSDEQKSTLTQLVNAETYDSHYRYFIESLKKFYEDEQQPMKQE